MGLVASTFRFRDASLSILVYWLLGAIGLPVFAGGAGGLVLLSLRQLAFCGDLLLMPALLLTFVKDTRL